MGMSDSNWSTKNKVHQLGTFGESSRTDPTKQWKKNPGVGEYENKMDDGNSPRLKFGSGLRSDISRLTLAALNPGPGQ